MSMLGLLWLICLFGIPVGMVGAFRAYRAKNHEGIVTNTALLLVIVVVIFIIKDY